MDDVGRKEPPKKMEPLTTRWRQEEVVILVTKELRTGLTPTISLFLKSQLKETTHGHQLHLYATPIIPSLYIFYFNPQILGVG